MKKILITGAGRRIGRELALLFAQHNWEVIIHYNKSQQGALKTQNDILNVGGKCHIFQADISNISEIESKFPRAFSEFGVPDVLINNSGIFPPTKSIFEITSDDIDKALNINTKSILFISKEFAKLAKKGSKIINIHSVGSLEIWKNRIDYNLSKSAALTLTKSLARELAPNISVNAINPGYVNLEEKPDDQTKNNINSIPMQRYTNIYDIFDAVHFFATCSIYITAQYLNIDGGYHDCR